MITYYERNREKCLARQRKYNVEHRSQRNMHDKEYYHQHKEVLLKRMKDYYYKNKAKRLAKIRAWRHIPIGKKCEKCGSMENLERHHPDYNKPLEIQTLCRICHTQLHFGLKEALDGS